MLCHHLSPSQVSTACKKELIPDVTTKVEGRLCSGGCAQRGSGGPKRRPQEAGGQIWGWCPTQPVAEHVAQQW